MNKNAIFIPLMLFAIQPNKILGAANETQSNKVLSISERAEEELREKLTRRDSSSTPLGGRYLSDSSEVERLFKEYGHESVDIIRKHCPYVSIHFYDDKGGRTAIPTASGTRQQYFPPKAMPRTKQGQTSTAPPELMKSAPKPTVCAFVPYTDWSDRVTRQQGATCGYHAVWNLAQIMAYLQSNDVEQANQTLRQGPPLGEWQRIINRFAYTDIDDREVRQLAEQVQGLQPNDITIIPNIGEWGPFLDENFAKVAERLQTTPGTVHGFLVNTAGHTGTSGTATFGGHWTAIAAKNEDGAIHLHVADSAYDPSTGYFGNQKTIIRTFEWLTTPVNTLQVLTRIPSQLEQAEAILEQDALRHGEVQNKLTEILAQVESAPDTQNNPYYMKNIKPRINALQQQIDQLKEFFL